METTAIFKMKRIMTPFHGKKIICEWANDSPPFFRVQKMIRFHSSEYKNDHSSFFRVQTELWRRSTLPDLQSILKEICSSPMSQGKKILEAKRWVTKMFLMEKTVFKSFIDADFLRLDTSQDFLYACSASSFFRNEYKLGNRVFLQVISYTSKKRKDCWRSFRI